MPIRSDFSLRNLLNCLIDRIGPPFRFFGTSHRCLFLLHISSTGKLIDIKKSEGRLKFLISGSDRFDQIDVENYVVRRINPGKVVPRHNHVNKSFPSELLLIRYNIILLMSLYLDN